MNIKLVLLLVLVAVLETMLASAHIITSSRRFPGERRLGSTNYRASTFGVRGFMNRPIARHTRTHQQGSFPNRKPPPESYPYDNYYYYYYYPSARRYYPTYGRYATGRYATGRYATGRYATGRYATGRYVRRYYG
ncbi:uncharacterized protein [Cherax quadricarinatus]|uniref:uncharacterized protein isoform X1 n=2 Tax=Cherax quadricarinatus TaxID=27406 RepID=UPI002378336E|nr:uncharacterized protein LOC128686565 [Cherax quadricarinatus]